MLNFFTRPMQYLTPFAKVKLRKSEPSNKHESFLWNFYYLIRTCVNQAPPQHTRITSVCSRAPLTQLWQSVVKCNWPVVALQRLWCSLCLRWLPPLVWPQIQSLVLLVFLYTSMNINQLSCMWHHLDFSPLLLQSVERRTTLLVVARSQFRHPKQY